MLTRAWVGKCLDFGECGHTGGHLQRLGTDGDGDLGATFYGPMLLLCSR